MLKAKSTTAKHAALTATVSGSTAPIGAVDFFEGATLIKAGVPLTSGQATLNVKTTPGSHTYTANFVPDLSSPDDPSTAQRTVMVKAAATVSESFPATVAKGKRAKGTVTVTLTGVSAKATGTVKVMEGKKAIASGKLAKGKVTITLPKLSKGKHSLKADWAGDSHGAAASKAFKITQK